MSEDIARVDSHPIGHMTGRRLRSLKLFESAELIAKAVNLDKAAAAAEIL